MTSSAFPLTMTAQAFEELHRRHGQSLFRYVLSMTFGDRHAAEDITQEVMLRAWQQPDLMTDRAASARSWLVTVARNLVIDRLRRRQCRPREDGEVELELVPATSAEPDRVAVSVAVRAALAGLTPARRQILVELYYHDRSLKEVSERLGIPVGTVKSRAYYALRALRAALEDRPAAAGRPGAA